MIKDPLQAELDRYYSYGNDNCVRYTHRLRINRIQTLVKELSDRYRGPDKPKALDAGCNSGVYSILMADAGFEVLGLDINEQDVRKASHWAHERGFRNELSFQVGDIQGIESEDSRFDLIICSEVLEHLDDPNRGITELYRVLKPNGSAIISMPNMGCIFGVLQLIYRKTGIRAAMGKPPLDIFQIQHSRYWFGNILSLLKQNGFGIERKYSTSHLPYAWHLDALLDAFPTANLLACRVEGAIAAWPLLRYAGFNFIVLARKPAT